MFRFTIHGLALGLIVATACGGAADPASAPAPPAPATPTGLAPPPAPPEPPRPPSPVGPVGPVGPVDPVGPVGPVGPQIEREVQIRITEEGIFGPGVMITEDGIFAPGIAITRDSLRLLDDDDGPLSRMLKGRLDNLGREIKAKLEDKGFAALGAIAIEDGRLKLGDIEIQLGGQGFDVPSFVLDVLSRDLGDDQRGAASRTSCTEGDCDMRCEAGTTCKASCSGGGCRQSCADGATCHFSCAGGDCFQRCEAESVCKLTCSGGDCRRACAKTATCTATCSGDACSDAP